jgi:cephalosporin-C deacetylase
MTLRSFALWWALAGFAWAEVTPPAFTPYKKHGIYALGETVGWKVTAPATPATTYRYVIRRNNLDEIGAGTFASGESTVIETKLDEPGMVYVEITSPVLPVIPDKPYALGAAVAPEKIGPAIPAPRDFDAFWAAKLRALRAVPARPELTPKPSGREGVDYATLRMHHLDGRHVWGQVAKPHDATRKKKFPALVLFQWAGVYPLQKDWITGHAADGWLVVNIQPHDLPADAPQSFFDALPAELKSYNTIESRNRDRNYFLYMYLADIRALDYLTSRGDWDGRTLVVTGTSMGGQQSLCAAALHPKVTALVVHVPAGADANGTAHGRRTGYPFWDPGDPEVMRPRSTSTP